MVRALTILASIALLLGSLSAQEPEPVPVPPQVEPPQQEPEPKPKPEPKPDPAPGVQEPVDAPTGEDPKKPAPDADAEKPAERGDGEDGEQTPKEQPAETEVDLPSDAPYPDGADPADLRAMRSAQDMVSAERRLRAAIKSGTIRDVEKLLSFEEISSWPYRDGLEGMPTAVRELDGDEVVMIGFMLPIDEVEEIREFLLVQSLWACCYGTPPDINGIVRVVMKGKNRVDYQFDPIQVRGTFDVEATTEDGYVIDIYQLHASSVKLVK